MSEEMEALQEIKHIEDVKKNFLKWKKNISIIEKGLERNEPKPLKQKLFNKNTDREEYVPQCPNCLTANYDLLHLEQNFCPVCGQGLKHKIK
jgi:hypothetical protein